MGALLREKVIEIVLPLIVPRMYMAVVLIFYKRALVSKAFGQSQSNQKSYNRYQGCQSARKYLEI